MSLSQAIPKRATLLTYALFLYAFLPLYLFPYGSIAYAKVLLPIVVALFIFELIDGKIVFFATDIFLIIGLILCNIIPVISLNRLPDAIIMIILFLKMKEKLVLNKTFVIIVYILGLISSIYYLVANYNTQKGILFVINNPDPNFSGLLALLFFLFCYKEKHFLGIIFTIVCVILLWSRNFMVSLVFFFILLIVEKFLPGLYNFFSKRMNTFKFALILLLLNILVIFQTFSYLKEANSPLLTEGDLNRNSINRFINLQDASNWYRFNSNKEFYQLINDRRDILLFGVSGVEPNMEEREYGELLPTGIAPHNSLFYLIFMRGILFASFYILTVSIIINRLYTRQDIKYILPIFLFSLFLHGVYGGLPVIFFVIILSLRESKSLSL